MFIFCDESVSFGWSAWKKTTSEYYSTFIVKGTYQFLHEGIAIAVDEPAPLNGNVHYDEDPDRSLCYASDFVPYKPRADILLTGDAYVPDGQPVKVFDAKLMVGPVSKTVTIIGKRCWSRLAEPELFKSIALIYENAYGGPKNSFNPVGIGQVSDELPNIEYPNRLISDRKQKTPPAGFGPLAEAWEPRSQMIGTFGAEWFENQWPGYPEDIDWGFFNAAPADQQVKDYLRGDEALQLTNLHPEHSQYETQLPGLRIRLFLNQKKDKDALEFSEVRLNLDTMQIDMHDEIMNLVWRGVTPVKTIKLKEVEHILIVGEALDTSPLPQEHYRLHMQELLRARDEETEVGAVAPVVDPLEAEFEQMEREAQEVEKDFDRIEVDMADQEQRMLKEFAEAGVDLTQPIPIFDHDAFVEGIKVHDPVLANDLGDSVAETADAELEFNEMEREMEVMERDISESKPLLREDVIKANAAGESLAGKDLSGLDLSELDLSGIDLCGAVLRGTKLMGTQLSAANLNEARLTGADLSDAVLDGALLEDADLSKTTVTGCRFCKTHLNHATFTKLNLASVDFSGCTAVGTDFSDSNLTNAVFRKAVLHQANFTGSTLQETDFSEADLKAAQMEEVLAHGIIMVKASAVGLHAGDGSDFTGGNFTKLSAPNSNWDDSTLNGADFSRAILTNACFDSAQLLNTIFDYSRLESAVFDDADLCEASLRYANLLRASFDRTNLTLSHLVGSNLYEASFPDTHFHQTNLANANLKGTTLLGRI